MALLSWGVSRMTLVDARKAEVKGSKRFGVLDRVPAACGAPTATIVQSPRSIQGAVHRGAV
jgi:hypothetical protein